MNRSASRPASGDPRPREVEATLNRSGIAGDERSLTAMAIGRMALWFGLAVGLLELGLIFALKPLRDPSPGFFRMNRHALWMIPAFNLLLFPSCGIVLAIARRLRPRLGLRFAAGVFGYLAFLTLLLTYSRIHVWACLLFASGLAYRFSRRVGRNPSRYRLIQARTSPVLGCAVVGLVATAYVGGVVDSRAPKHEPARAANRPNVLLIVLDTTRADRMSLHGYHRATTPHLEQLAKRGVRFDRGRATAPWTLPSHASIFTGRWPHELSASYDGPLDGTYPTIGGFLRSKGYATGGFVANVPYAGAETGLSRGFSHFVDHDTSLAGVFKCSTLGSRVIWPVVALDPRVGVSAETVSRKDAALVGRQLLDWLDDQPRDQPYFAFMNVYDAHNPYLPPRDFKDRFGVSPTTGSDYHAIAKWFILDKKRLPPRQIEIVNDAYDNCLAYLDDQLGRLFRELELRRRLENTIVIVTADHGEHFGEHGVYGHASSLYDQEIRVPLLIVAPDGQSAGRIVDRSVSLREIPATIADLAGLGRDSPFPGRSLARYWDEKSDKRSLDAPVLSEVEGPARAAPNQGRSPAFRGSMQSLVVAEKLFIRNGDGVEELYDLEKDRDQLKNLASTPDGRALLPAMRDQLRRLLDDEPQSGEDPARHCKPDLEVAR
jgi:arylsulfatase A-like enzyme